MRFLTVAQPRVRLYQRFIPDFLPRDGVNQTGILFLSLVTRFLYRAKILNENETFIIRIFFLFFFSNNNALFDLSFLWKYLYAHGKN